MSAERKQANISTRFQLNTKQLELATSVHSPYTKLESTAVFVVSNDAFKACCASVTAVIQQTPIRRYITANPQAGRPVVNYFGFGDEGLLAVN